MNIKKTIGILGGGQLAKMLIEEAHLLGYNCSVLDPDKNACGGALADKFIVGSYSDKDTLEEFAKSCDVITYEFENVPIDAVKYLMFLGKEIPQGTAPLYISQHRVKEKSAVSKIGVKPPPYFPINSIDELIPCAEKLSYPVILKTCQGGYDGKNQWFFNNKTQVESFILSSSDIFLKELILEKVIDFKMEASCIAIRNLDGDLVTFPVSENKHISGILDTSVIPANLSCEIQTKIIDLTKKIMINLNFIGILAVEYFIDKNDEIYFNEMAPRPHNSGHHSQDSCSASQFKLHILSILNEKLEPPVLKHSCIMKNILGESKDIIEKYEKMQGAIIHLYGKDQWKTGRKMGHINFIK